MPDVATTVAPEDKTWLQAAGLLDLDALFTRADLVAVKAKLTDRQTLSVALPEGRVVFVKRYPKVKPPGLLRRSPFSSPAAREYEALRRLAELGVPTIHPLALLEERQGKRVTRAALLTLGLDAPQTLEQLVLAGLSARRRQALARQLAQVTRRMHDGGVNHRDYYLVHLRVGQSDRLFVTDLNRADLRREVPRRWVVKDLAALQFSAPAGVVTRTDRARFLGAYTGKPLRACRSLVKAILRKAAAMRANTARKVARGEANYHLR